MNFDKLYELETKYTIQQNEVEKVQEYFKKKSGWVYIAKIENLPYLKIGRTGKNPLYRAKTLSSTGVFNEYEIIYSLQFLNQFWGEKQTHQELKKFRVQKEFFALEQNYAIETIERINKIEENLLERFFDVKSAKESILNIGFELK